MELFFKQVIEMLLQFPSEDSYVSVKAVAWCHSRPSDGVVAAGLGDRVFVYHPNFSRGKGMKMHFLYEFHWRISSSGTGISRYRHPILSSGTGSVLEASSTASKLHFNPISVIQNWMTVSGTGYR